MSSATATASTAISAAAARRLALQREKEERLVALQREKEERRVAIQRAKENRQARSDAYRLEHPDAALSDTMYVLMKIGFKQGLRCDRALTEQFIQWKNHTEFPPKTNLYQKALQFIQMRCEESEPIPVFAKTMLGDLIPLEYHPDRDAQDMLIQLEKFDPQLYPLGSVSLTRSEENAGEPVEKSEIFFLFHLNNKHTTYLKQHEVCAKAFLDPDGFHPQVRVSYSFLVDGRLIRLYYFPLTQSLLISTLLCSEDYIHPDILPLNEAREYLLQHLDQMYVNFNSAEVITDMFNVFEAIRRDRF